MRKLVLVVAAAAAVGLIGWGVAQLATSSETRIRRRLEAMAEGFNEARLRPIAAGLAPGFTSPTEGVDRATLLDGLRAHFFEHVKGPFPYRVRLPRERLSVDVHEGGDTADADLVAEFERRGDEDWESAWEVEVRAALTRDEEGWRVVRAETVTLAGAPRRLR